VLVPAQLVTARLVLTPLTVDDAAAMVEVLADGRMYDFTGGHPPTLDELHARYERLARGRSADGGEVWFNWIVRPADTPAPVGVMQATVAADASTADVAWEIGVPWQGRGFATEAAGAVVTWLTAEGVPTIRALIHPDHVASGRVALRTGLVATPALEDGEVVWLAGPGPP
jgi:RimJ/RimL family protein N-acetyltransferase